ncbi:MAG: T9SS type A sorting domain-containing protein [Sphaerochaetaceae bacterium]
MKTLTLILLSFISTMIVGQTRDWGDTLFTETITFENIYPYIELDTSAQNLWQIGVPSKAFFDSAYSAKNAIVTDTINPYSTNNHSYFDLLIGNFNYTDHYPWNIFVGIKHKYDTDSLKDGGFITISYDNRNTWMNIINDTVYEPSAGVENENFYRDTDTLFNGEHGFSGNSKDWQSTWFAWHEIRIKSRESIGDTIVLRFNFISDSIQENKDGWMIDDITLYAIDLGSSIQEHGNKLPFNVSPNPANSLLSVILQSNYSNIKLELFNLRGQIIDQKEFAHTNSFEYNVKQIQPGIYLIKISNEDNSSGIKRLIIQ